MYALILCISSEPACLALSAARFDPAHATLITVDNYAQERTWRAPARFVIDYGRFEIIAQALFSNGGFE